MKGQNRRLIENLKKLGLTQNEARVLAAIIKLGSADASNIVKISGIPHSKIYSTISKLTEKDFVTEESSSGGVKLYKITDFKNQINKLKRKNQQVVEKSAINAIKTLEEIQNSLYKNSTPNQEVWTYKGKKKVIQIMVDIIERAKDQLICNIPSNLLVMIQDQLISAKAQGIQIYLIVLSSSEDPFIDKIQFEKFATEMIKFDFNNPLHNPFEKIIDDKDTLINLKEIFYKSRTDFPCTLAIDPSSEDNYHTLLILNSDNPEIEIIGIEFINNSWKFYHTQFFNLIWGYFRKIGRIQKFN